MPEPGKNRLALEKSPYLLEHAQNPVDWWPWGKEALAKAKNDNKPVFLSVGYSTCHWCHVMRRESFEDEKTAAFLNKNFIPIKVDREERPEIDAYYMQAVQAMTGGGGWPLSVFLTPDLKPFYGGTYFPPEPRYGMPSFMQVLEFVSNLWKDKREEVLVNTGQVQKALDAQKGDEAGELRREVLDDAYAELVSSFDSSNGGFGSAPKFPLPGSLEFLLRYHFRNRSTLSLDAVLKTLDHMMAGGIRDHVGGGFHRYSTDRVWLVPHFEKMLYDNALLAKVYVEAHQVTGREDYGEVARSTLGWMVQEMEGPGGGFYSAQDADTEEGEGTFYTWTPSEVTAVLGAEDGAAFSRAYGVTATGNFGGRSILHLDPAVRTGGKEKAAMEKRRGALYLARSKRSRPATDDKILTSWNGLAISAFAIAGSVLDELELIRHARKAAEFILSKCSRDGKLMRRFAGGEAALPGTLEDYSYFLQGLVDLFEADPDPRWLKEAVNVADTMVADLADNKDGGFYFTSDPEPARLKESYDGPTPSGNSVAALSLLRLGELTGEQEYRSQAERTLRSFGNELSRRPTAHTVMLSALDLALNGGREVVVTARTEAGAAPMVAAVNRRFIPDRVLLVATDRNYGELQGLTKLLEGREPLAKPRAYVCRNYACRVPADDAEALSAQLEAR